MVKFVFFIAFCLLFLGCEEEPGRLQKSPGPAGAAGDIGDAVGPVGPTGPTGPAGAAPASCFGTVCVGDTTWSGNNTYSNQVIFEGDPTGTGIDEGAVYINPAGAASSEILFGIADNSTARFTLNKTGETVITGTPTGSGVSQGVFSVDTLGAAGASDTIFSLASSGSMRMTVNASGNSQFAGGMRGKPIRISNGSSTLLGSGGFLVLGNTGAENLVLDDVSIQARNNGTASVLKLNPLGGDIQLGAASSVIAFAGNSLNATRYQYSFLACRATSDQSFNSTASSTLIFNSEQFDNGSMYDPATGEITITEAGLYFLDVTLTLKNLDLPGEFITLQLSYAGGGSLGYNSAIFESNTGGPIVFSRQFLVALSAGSYELKIQSSADTSFDLDSASCGSFTSMQRVH